MAQQYTEPSFGKTAFHCPNCQVYALQRWADVYWDRGDGSYRQATAYKVCFCDGCNGMSMWYQSVMVVPDLSSVPPPVDDMPEDVKNDYNEAVSMFSRSPRSSAALLRLAVQKLCIDLGGSGKNLNDDIGALVKKGLPVEVQRALDVVRVVGNNQVHPGVLDVRDEPEIAAALFGLINLTVEIMITRPKQVQALFDKLPATAQQQIQKRDGNKP